jgi:hypothetical protein
LNHQDLPLVSISYFSHQLPTFLLPPLDITGVKIVHGSCRKPHGDGDDALALLDRILAARADFPADRPQQLFLTGDQIYGDDVADPFLWIATYLGDLLLGWEEMLMIGHWDRVEFATPIELPAGDRAEIATRKGGFTAGLHRKRDKVTSHLFGLGEYYGAYLLAWSPIVWPNYIPTAAEMQCPPERMAAWDREVLDLQDFRDSLPEVRRALANVATYTIFDDHDVSDDWNLNQAWCLRVLGKPLGRRVVRNALLAYALFQAWGNTPSQFATGSRGEELWQLVEELTRQGGYNDALAQEIGRYLGLPPRHLVTNLPEFEMDGEELVLARDEVALRWDYCIDMGAYLVIVCDTRTQRGYPAKEKPIAPPSLICRRGLQAQVFDRVSALNGTAKELLIVVPTNLFGLAIVDWIHQHQLGKRKVFSTDVGDAWNIRHDVLAGLLNGLAKSVSRAIVLTGDIHYAGAMKFTHRSRGNDGNTRVCEFVQFTASAYKNEEFLTRLLQSKVKSWLLREPIRHSRGNLEPATMNWLSSSPLDSLTVFFRHDEFENLSANSWRGTLKIIGYRLDRSLSFSESIDQQDKNLLNLLFSMWYDFRHWLDERGEIVGKNNIGIINWGDDSDSDYSQVFQDVYWLKKHRFPRELSQLRVAKFRVNIRGVE